MGFRTLEISHAAEIHIKEGQLEITTDDGVAVVPIEDLNQIMVHGANIRLSTMDLSILSQNKVALMTKHISNHPRINPHFFAPLCSSLSNYNTLVEKSHFSKMIFILLFCRKTTSQMTLSFVFVEYTAHLCRQLWIYTNKTVRAIFMYG